jgi:hypothetical protein
MSLKAFHLFFIFASALLAAGLGGWSLSQYSALGEGWLLGLGIGSFVVTAGLIVYFPWFLRRYRSFSYLSLTAFLAAGLTASPSAWACAVCFGDPNSTMVKSANAGIWALMAVIVGVLLAFIGLFGFWWSRARKIEKESSSRLAA